MAVFGSNGELLTSNRRYGELWDSATHSTLDDHIAGWLKTGGQSPGLTALREALNAALPDEPLRGAMAGPAGGLMSWVLRPLSGGRFLVSFADAMPAAAAPRAAQGEDVSSLRPDDLSVQRATG